MADCDRLGGDFTIWVDYGPETFYTCDHSYFGNDMTVVFDGNGDVEVVDTGRTCPA